VAEPYELTLHAAARAIRARTLSPVELTRSLLARIAAREPAVLAWARLTDAAALTEAARCEDEAMRGAFRGALHGVPVGIKDLFYTAGVETAAGSAVLAGFTPAYDATAVRRLRDAGAVVLGKTALSVFAAMDPGPTRNPWNPAHTPGGSSSGSAAAVAALMCPAALGTQTAGSIVRPASYCGVVGLKPTYGRVSRHGLVASAWSMDHVGPLTRTVADAALVLETIAGPDVDDPSACAYPVPTSSALSAGPARPFRVGVPDRYFLDDLDPAVKAAFDVALASLADAGGRVEPVRLPGSFETGVDAGVVAMYAELAAYHAQWFETRRADYTPKLAALIETGRTISATSYLRAQQVRRVAARDISRLLDGVDVLATPATPTPAPEGLGFTGHWRLNLPFSASGHPAISVPMGRSEAGLPLGLQLVGRHFDEATLLRVAAAYEARSAAWPTC
jgi:aspartyl-tRNA(Asn)/glutamyl-tRNA(Gln) amidotransferase subunit A